MSTYWPAVKWQAPSSVPTGSRASGVTLNSASLRLTSTPAAAKCPRCLQASVKASDAAQLSEGEYT